MKFREGNKGWKVGHGEGGTMRQMVASKDLRKSTAYRVATLACA